MRFRLALAAVFVLGALALSPAALASTYTVVNTGDGGDGTPGNNSCEPICTLRAAIQEANAHLNVGFPDRIEFSIGAGPQLIPVPAALPAITEPVVIDATTQPGPGSIPLIRLNGTGSANHDGIVIAGAADGSEVKGLSLTEFKAAVKLDGSATVTQNFIGLKPDGAAAPTQNGTGVEVGVGTGSTIGDNADPALGNVISNNGVGVTDEVGGGARLYSNFIGTNVAGTAAIANGVGVTTDMAGLGGAVIIGNTISGNTDDGVHAEGGAGFISFNKIGTNAAGTAAVPNGGSGVEVQATINAFTGNTISGNLGGGVVILSGSSSTLDQNFIGTNSAGAVIPNTGSGGIAISNPAGGNLIGGPDPGDGNVIANNSPWGIRVTAGAGNQFRRNSFFNNSGLAIDLGSVGVLPNDAGDTDGDPNDQQNYPVLTSAFAFNSVTGTLNSRPNQPYTIELYSSATCDPSGNGEGAVFIGTVAAATDAAGNAAFSMPLPPAVGVGRQITATATDGQDDTSEFSACRVVMSRAPAPGGGVGQDARRPPDSDIRRFPRYPGPRRFRIRGTATDPDGDLARVQVAFVRVTGGARASAKKAKRCFRLRSNGKLRKGKAGKRGRCKITGFLKVKGTAKWSFKLKRRLPKGKYVVYSRAVDKAGNREKTFSKRDKNRRAFTVR